MKKFKSKVLLLFVLTLLLGTARLAMGSPANDDCKNAKPVGNVTNLAFDITSATFDGPGYFITTPNIWYCYTATCTGNVTVNLCGSINYDTELAVYQGCSCYPVSSNLIKYNDDDCAYQSRVTFAATAGEKYLIEIGGSVFLTSEGVMSIRCEGEEPPSPPPPHWPQNDDCHNAKPVGNVTNLPFDTSNATFDGPGLFVISPNIWYSYTAACTGDVTVSLCGSKYDTKLAIYNGDDCYPASGDLIKYNDDSCGWQSEATFAVIAGNKYLIEVGGFGSKTGEGVISIRCEGEEPPPPPPPHWPQNDDCHNAKPVSNVTDLPFDTSNATFDGPGYFMTSPNIWYCYTATCTGDVTVDLCGSSYDTKLAVYKGCNCYPTSSNMIASNDDDCAHQSRVTFAATAGERFLIEVGGYGSRTGEGVISIRCEGPPPSEKFDLGDAPDSTNNRGVAMTAYAGQQANFPTVFNDTSGLGPYGPIHHNPRAVAYLGNRVSYEGEADIGPDADGANNIKPPSDKKNADWHDDGVTFPVNMPHCRWTTLNYLVKVINPGTDLWINIWCDWNRDGDWDDDSNTYSAFNCSKGPVSEWAVQNQYLFNLPAGIHKITTPAFLPWHPKSGPKSIWMRITLSGQPWTGGSNPGTKGNGGSGPQIGYEIGETEDYWFSPDTSYSECEDFNGDGVVNIQDLSTFTADWLANCPQ